MEKQWEVGDQAYYNFQKVIIGQVVDGRVQEVKSGTAATSGHFTDRELIEVSEHSTPITMQFQGYYKELCDRYKHMNHPAISEWLANWWQWLCRMGDQRAYRELSGIFDQEYHALESLLRTAHGLHFSDFKILRP